MSAPANVLGVARSTASPRAAKATSPDQLLSAMRKQFGGHGEIAATAG